MTVSKRKKNKKKKKKNQTREMAQQLRGLIGGSCRGPMFHSQNPHGGSQPYTIPVLGDPMPSFNLFRNQACIWCTYMHSGKHSHGKNKTNIFNKGKLLRINYNCFSTILTEPIFTKQCMSRGFRIM